MSHRSRLSSRKRLRQEHELRIIANPLVNAHLLEHDDYQAPLTARTLSPSSKWIIVRNNIHKIRSWGGIDGSHVDQKLRDWYVLVQTRRELRRAQKQIRQIERSNFIPVCSFDLPIAENRHRRYNVSHLQPSDTLYHPSFGTEPVVLQSLLYYFSEECAVPYNSIFRPFLSDVCSILNKDRQRLNRAAVFRKVALAIAIIIFVMLALMFCSLVLSALSTTSNLRDIYRNHPDGGIDWQQPETSLKTSVHFL